MGRAKKPLILTSVGAVLLASGFLGGKILEGKSCKQKLADKQSTIDEQQSTLEADQNALRQARRHAKVLEADRHLHLAVIALEDRNFGTAGDHVSDAHELLKQARESSKEKPNSAVGEVEKSIADWQPDVSRDVGGQRDQLRDYSEKLGTALQ